MSLLLPWHWFGLESLSKTALVAKCLKRKNEREGKIESRKDNVILDLKMSAFVSVTAHAFNFRLLHYNEHLSSGRLMSPWPHPTKLCVSVREGASLHRPHTLWCLYRYLYRSITSTFLKLLKNNFWKKLKTTSWGDKKNAQLLCLA